MRTPATHRRRGRRWPSSRCAQRRPGCEPRRRSVTGVRLFCVCVSAQRRPGCEPRRRPAPGGVRARPTRNRSTKAGVRTPATRVNRYRRLGPVVARSTKAGVRTPATRVVERTRDTWDPIAQRRPGCEPRRRRRPSSRVRFSSHRSTKAGVRTPATHEGEASAGGTHVPRSTKAGVRTPATPETGRRTPGISAPLNEGRGANPGDALLQLRV